MPYDAIVLGAGPGGYPCAIRLGQLGQKVAIVEEKDLGGVCLNVGCIPSKALIHAAEVYQSAREAKEFGLSFDNLRVDLPALIAWKDKVVKRLTGGIGGLLKGQGVEIFKGRGKILGKGRVEVTGGGESKILEAKNLVIATGSRPIELPFLPFGQGVISSTEALAPDRLPGALIVVGGGVIGLELGQVYARLGSKVTVVEMLDRILPGTDPELAGVLQKRMAKEGVEFLLSHKAKSLARDAAGLKLTVEGGKGERVISADKILVAIGRRPNTENLGLDSVDIKTEKGFIPVDLHGRAADGIYAIGDVTPGPLLAHRASKEGALVAAAIAGRDGLHDVRAMPAAVYTVPEIATVGLSEDEAKAAGLKIKVGRFPLAASGRALTQGTSEGMVKVVALAESDTLLGVGIVGPHASELIAEAAAMIEMGAQAEDLALTVHPHPTLSEAVMEAAEAVHGMAIHIPKRP